jgi:hypothetical protein
MDELCQFWGDRAVLRLAALADHEPRPSAPCVGGAPYVSPFHWTQLFGAWGCLCVAAGSLRGPRRVWRFYRGPTCRRCDGRPFTTHIVGHGTRMAI